MSAAIPIDSHETTIDFRDLVGQVRSNAQFVNAASTERLKFVSELIERSRSIGDEIVGLRLQSGKTQENLQVTADAAEGLIREVQSIVDLMDHTVRGIAAFGDRIAAFESSFEEVKSISNAIADVADRTDVLSMNAMIEAARAGEHGRGFQVVANEVRELATSSGASAEKISVRLNSLLNGAESMSKDCSELYELAVESGRRGQKNFEKLKSIHADVANSVSDTRVASQSTGNHINQFADLVSGMEKLRSDTQTAIKGSAKNIELTSLLEQRLSSDRWSYKLDPTELSGNLSRA